MDRASERELVYWVAVVGAEILIILDITETDVTSIVALALIAAAVFLRPGGIRGSRSRPGSRPPRTRLTSSGP